MSFVALLAALTISVAPGTEAKNATAVSELKYHLKLALGEDPAIVTDGDGTFVVGVKPDGAPDAGSLESRYQVKGGKVYSLAAFARKPDWILTCRSGSSPHVRATATRSGGTAL